MGQVREVDAISDAIIETEREIAGEAWGNEDTERADSTGDRTLESMGDGLEGQHEAGDEDAETEGEEEADGEGDDEAGDDGEGEGDEEAEGQAEPKDDTKGEVKPEAKAETREQTQGRVPSGKLREEAERRRQVEAERDDLKAKLEAATGQSTKITALEAQLAQLTQLLQGGQRQQPQAPAKEEPVTPPKAPDIFEDPTGFVEHIKEIVQQAVTPVRTDLRKQSVETSFALAHVQHKDAFEGALAAINGLNPQNPDDRATVQRIYNSANPGEELVKWHKRSTALSRVGDDPDAYERGIEERTRQALMNDPEFRKQLLASLRQEAATGGPNGGPRTEPRLPPSLARRGGSNLGVERGDHDRHDGSEQAVADAAWR